MMQADTTAELARPKRRAAEPVLHHPRVARLGRDRRVATARHVVQSGDGAPLIIGDLRDGTGRPQDQRNADEARQTQQLLGSAGLVSWSGLVHGAMLEALTHADPSGLRADLGRVDALIRAWIGALDQRRDASATPDGVRRGRPMTAPGRALSA
jgi:hypothetical protein